MRQIDGKLYDMIYNLMKKKPSYTETESTVLPNATYKAHYLVVDKNWYEITNSFLNIFLNIYLISPNGNANKNYSTYVPNKQMLDVCRMCLKQIKEHKEIVAAKPVVKKSKVVLQKPKVIKTIIKNPVTNKISIQE